jgi:beta-lactamase regulating signal transducer with metallopeptidase domain
MSEYWISTEWLQRLAGSLLHFVWEGAFLAFIAAILLHLLARRSAAVRYTVAVTLLGLMLLVPCVTVFFYAETGSATLRLFQLFGTSFGRTGPIPGAENAVQWTWWIVLGWATGVTASSIRLIAGWMLSLRLIRSARATVPPTLSLLMERTQSALLAKGREARLLIGERVTGPVVFGWLRPVVLLPVSAVTGLNESQLLAILAHELAHVRRHDFLVNTLQRCIESVLFYHPAVWWLSARIRKERELCCDDLAVSVCGDRLAYAEALIELERTRPAIPALAVPATGGLTGRIRRLLGSEDVNRDWQPAMVALLLLATCAIFGMWQGETIGAPAIAAATLTSPASTSTAEIAAVPPSTIQPSEQPSATIENALGAVAAIATAQVPQAAAAGERWITTWGAAYTTGYNAGPECCNDQTIRMFMRVSVGGTSVRLRLSNAYGTAPLFLGQVRVALHDRGSEIIAGTDRQLSFGGRQSVEIPIGASVTSDPVSLDIPAMADLAVSIYAPNDTGSATADSGSRSGYRVSGDQAGYTGMTGAKLTSFRYWVSGIEVLRPSNAGVIVVTGSLDNFKDRETSVRGWAGLLEARLQAGRDSKNISVVVSGDAQTLLRPFQSQYAGRRYPDAFDAIVTSQTGIRELILCGDNSIMGLGTSSSLNSVDGFQGLSLADRMIKMFKRVIDQAASQGITTIGCTLPPTGRIDKEEESARQAVNAWIRSSGTFAGVLDFDAITRTPGMPDQLNPEFGTPGSNYGLPNLNDHAYKAVADSIDLSLFTR